MTAGPGSGSGSGLDAAPQRARAGAWLLVALLVAIALPRVLRLDLDPPDVVVAGYDEEAHFRDEAAKAHEARNWATWGRWSLSEHDEYGFWRAQSPSWVWGEALWLEAFGVGVVQARSFVVVHSLVAAALLVWLALLRRGLPTAIAVGVLVGFNWALLVFSRLALMEGALLCWLVVATVALAQLDRRPEHAGRWAALATTAMLVACTIKQTGLLLAPAFAGMMVFVGLRAGAGIVQRREAGLLERVPAMAKTRPAAIALVAVAAMGGVLATLVLDPAYQERLAFNADHFTEARDDSVAARAWQAFRHALPRVRLMFVELAPAILWLAAAELVRLVVVGLRHVLAKGRAATTSVRIDVVDAWMLIWALLALAANLASPHRAIRFQLILLPPAAWLAATLVGRVWSYAWPAIAWRRAVRGVLVALALVEVARTSTRLVEWIEQGQHSAVTIGDELVAIVGDRDAVVVGEFAAQAVFETPYRHFYVRPGQFNDDAATIAALGITHMVVAREDDFVERRMRKVVPRMLASRRLLGTVWFRGEPLDVWALDPATDGGHFPDFSHPSGISRPPGI